MEEFPSRNTFEEVFKLIGSIYISCVIMSDLRQCYYTMYLDVHG